MWMSQPGPTIIFLIAGWVWGALMWLVSMWMYRHRRQPSQ
jgi:hypothetical protein